MPLAVATLSESKPAAIGMRTVRVRARSAGGRPGPSAPRRSAVRGARRYEASGSAPRRAQRHDLEPGLLERADEVAGGAAAGKRRDQRRPDRDADRLAVERVAGGLVEQHRVGAERRGVAEDAADIVVVCEPDEAEDGRDGAGVPQQLGRAMPSARAGRPPGRRGGSRNPRPRSSPPAARHRPGPRGGTSARTPPAAARFSDTSTDSTSNRERARSTRSTTSPSAMKRPWRPMRSRSRTAR